MRINITLTAKRALRWSVLISVMLLAVLLSGLFLLTLAPGEKLLRQFSEAQLATILGHPVEIGELETNLLLHLRAKQINVFPVAGPRNKPLLQLRSARLEYRLWDIFRHSLRIKSITLDSLYLNLQRDSSGYFSLFRRLQSPKSDTTSNGSSRQFHLARLALTNSMIEYEDHLIPLAGKLYDLNVTLSSPEIEHYLFQLAADSVNVTHHNVSFTARQTKINGMAGKESIHLDSIFVGLPGLDLTGNVLAKLDSTPSPLQGRLRLRGTLQPMAKLLANYLPAQLQSLAGELDLRALVAGTADSPQLDLESEFTNLRIAGANVPKANVHLKYEKQTARLEQFRAELWDGTLAGNGELTLDSLLTHRLNLRLDAIDFQKLWESAMAESLPLAGKVSGEFASQGSHLALEKLDISSSLSLRDAAFDSHPFENVGTTLTVREGKALLGFQQGENHLWAEVKIGDRALDGLIGAVIPELSTTIAPFGIRDLTGAVNLTGNISGTIDSPALNIKLAGSRIAYWNFPADTITARLAYQNAQFQIEESFLSSSVAEIDTLRPPFDFAGWRGGFRYETNLSGPLNQLQGKLVADLQRPVLADYAFDKGNLELSLKDSALHFDSIRLYKDSLQIGAMGEYNIPADLIRGQMTWSFPVVIDDTSASVANIENELAFHFDFADSASLLFGLQGENIDLRILNILLAKGQMIHGQASFDLQGEGSLRNPHLYGQFGIREGTFQLRPEAESIQHLGLQLVFADSVIQIEDISGEVGTIPFRLYGEIIGMAEKRIFTELNLNLFSARILNSQGTISPDSIDYKINIDDLSLSLFEPLISQVKNLSGSLNSTLSIAGTLAEPLIVGNLEVDDLSFKPRLQDYLLNRGLLRLQFNQNQVRLDSMFLAMNDGYIAAAGNLMHDQGQPVSMDFQFTAHDLRFTEPKNYNAHLKSIKLDYKTQDNVHHLVGDIILGDSRLTRNIRTEDYFILAKQQVLATLEGPPKEPLDLLSFMKDRQISRKEMPAFLQQTQLDIRLRDSDSLWVDNNLAKIRMDAELNLVGSIRNPSLAGRLNIDEGQVEFLDRSFEVTQGALDFADPERANPLLNIEAETTSKPLKEVGDEEYEILLKIFGPLDDFEYELTSRPVLEEPDIISLLTLGVTSSHLAGENGGSENGIAMTDALQQRMEILVTQQLNSRLTDYSSQLFGENFLIDQVGVGGNLFDKEEGGIWASKEIVDRLELRFTKSFKKLNNYNLQADYRLLRYIYLRGKINQKNESEGSFKFRLRFK